MIEALRKALMMGIAYNPVYSVAVFADDDSDAELDLIELDDDLEDAEKPPELRAGVYTAEVQDVQQQVSGKGNKYYAVKLVVPPEEIPADLQDDFPDGATLYWNRQTVPQTAKDRRAIFNLRKMIEAFGLSPKGTQFDPNDWMGCKCRIRVVMGKWQGEDRAEIKSLEPAESGARSSGRRGRDDDAEEAPRRTVKAAQGKGRTTARRGR